MTVNFQQIPYGGTYLGYAFGKEGVELVYSKGLRLDTAIAPTITDEGILDQIKIFQTSVGKHPKNAIFSAEISPTPEESKGWTNDDFRNIAIELMKEMDNPNLKDKRGKPFPGKTTVSNSMCAIVKHVDARSGIVHLHAMVSTIDLDGNAIPQHKIAERAIAACDNVNERHHWKQPKEIRDEHLKEINRLIYLTLKRMDRWDWNDFKYRLGFYGYNIDDKYDKQGKLVNYTLYRGNSKFKASDLGTDNCYTAAHIAKAWFELHRPQQTETKRTSTETKKPSISIGHNARNVTVSDSNIVDIPKIIYRLIDVGGKERMFSVPQFVFDIFKEDCTVPDNNRDATHENVIDTAVMLFLGYIDAATNYVESHGGGNAPTDDWGRKDDEDDWRYAHRCAKIAHSMMKPKIRYRRSR